MDFNPEYVPYIIAAFVAITGLYQAVIGRRSIQSRVERNAVEMAGKAIEMTNEAAEKIEIDNLIKTGYIEYLLGGIGRLIAQLEKLRKKPVFIPVSLIEFSASFNEHKEAKN